MKTFRFTGSPALYIECDVRMCHGRCPVSLHNCLNSQFTIHTPCDQSHRANLAIGGTYKKRSQREQSISQTQHCRTTSVYSNRYVWFKTRKGRTFEKSRSQVIWWIFYQLCFKCRNLTRLLIASLIFKLLFLFCALLSNRKRSNRNVPQNIPAVRTHRCLYNDFVYSTWQSHDNMYKA